MEGEEGVRWAGCLEVEGGWGWADLVGECLEGDWDWHWVDD